MNVVFILKGDPFSWLANEAFRVALALAINNEVYFIAVRDGVYVFTDWNPEFLKIEGFGKIFETIEYVDIKLIVEDVSAEERGLKEKDFKVKVDIKSYEEIKKIINSAEAVFVW